MATFRDVQLFILERTFKKITSDFLSLEDEISSFKKSAIRNPEEYPDIYGFWNHFYLNEEYKKRDLHAVLSGKTGIFDSFSTEQVDIEHPLWDQMIDFLKKQEECLNKLPEDSIKILKFEDNEEVKLEKGQMDLSLALPIMHDIISSAQNNATISQLLEDFLANTNIKSLTKAVSVDASVTSIPQIQEHINSLSIADQIVVGKKVAKAKEKPIYSPNGNNQTFLASIFICQVDNLGLLLPSFGYSDTDIYELAIKNEAITLDFDESTFLKKLRAYKKLKSQGSNLT